MHLPDYVMFDYSLPERCDDEDMLQLISMTQGRVSQAQVEQVTHVNLAEKDSRTHLSKAQRERSSQSYRHHHRPLDAWIG